jgi:monoamine oxidase
MNGDAAKIDSQAPWTTANADELDRRSLADWIAALEVSDVCKTGVDAMLTADNGVVTDWQSYLANLSMVKGHGVERFWTDTELYRCKGGNQLLATRLAAALAPERVMLKTPVTRIEILKTGVRVTLAGGKALEGDEVIYTVPPPVWNKVAIDPMLPPQLTPQMGANVKFLIGLKSAVWRRTELAPDLLTDGPIHLTWHGTDGQRGPGEGLVAFSGGPSADITRSWGNERTATYLRELEKVYKGIRTSFVKSRYMDWPADTWVKASYSFPAPGQVTALGPILSSPHAERLHFAGEHTSYGFIGYMEGALSSGLAVAKRLTARDGVMKVA